MKKKVKIIEADKLFKEAIESRKGLIEDVYFRISEVVGSLSIVEKNYLDDTDSYELIQVMRVLKRNIEETRNKMEEHPSERDPIMSPGAVCGFNHICNVVLEEFYYYVFKEKKEWY